MKSSVKKYKNIAIQLIKIRKCVKSTDIIGPLLLLSY